MKKMFLILALFASYLFGNNVMVNNVKVVNGPGIEVGTKISQAKDKNILGIQSLKEIVGDGGTEAYIDVFYKYNFSQIGIRYTNLSESDDNKLELSWKLHLNEPVDTRFKFFLNGGFGFGVKGAKTETLSTNITRVDYITNSDLEQFKTAGRASIDSTNYISFSIGLGTSYNITDNFKIIAGYEFERKSMDIDYKIEGKRDEVSLSGLKLDSHGARIALSYIF